MVTAPTTTASSQALQTRTHIRPSIVVDPTDAGPGSAHANGMGIGASESTGFRPKTGQSFFLGYLSCFGTILDG